MRKSIITTIINLTITMEVNFLIIIFSFLIIIFVFYIPSIRIIYIEWKKKCKIIQEVKKKIRISHSQKRKTYI